MKKRQKNMKKWLLLLFLTAFVGLDILFFTKENPQPSSIVSGDFLPEEKDAGRMDSRDVKKAAQKAVDRSKFNMVIAPKAHFISGDQVGELFIQNPANNAYPVNVEITQNDSGELLYTSGAIQPGYEIKEVRLEQKLPQGEYPATATFSLYDEKTKEKRGEVAAKITIYVKN